MSREKGGLAWPGARTLARLTNMKPATVTDVVRRLEARGHLDVTRTQRAGEHGVNRYLPKLRSAASQNVPDISRTAATDTRVTLQTVTPCNAQTVTEPPTEPLNEPLSYIEAAVWTAVDINSANRQLGRKRSGEEVRSVEASLSATPSSKPSIPQRCYALVRRHYPAKIGLVTRALREYPESDVLEYIESCIESDDDLGHALWVVGS